MSECGEPDSRSAGGSGGPPPLNGVPLVGDGVTPGIMLVDGTVRRPVRPFTPAIHAFLAHLRRAGFTDAPVPLGIDGQGREVLSYVKGDVPREPLPPETAGEDVLTALAHLIRRLHEAATGWTPPADATWGNLPGSSAAPPVDGDPELVGHRDYCPGNVVFRDGLPAALIDFDLARPTSRLYDVANALYWWAPLLDPQDRAPAFADLDIPHRVTVFADAYGLTGRQRTELVPLATRMIQRFHRTARAAADADPVFRRLWDEGVKDRMPRAESWITQYGPTIAAHLTESDPTGT
jgi:aminoglycoside phosphotransferase (APT) family kinase protein